MEKTATIVKMEFTNSWTTPQGITLHVHEVMMDNGDSGKVYMNEISPSKYTIGTSVKYSKNKDKIKFIDGSRKSSELEDKKDHKITYYLGFAYGYAKEIALEEFKKDAESKVVDLERVKSVAEELYTHIEELFEGKHKNDAFNS